MNGRPRLDDEENWAFYLEPGEQLIGTWRPYDTLRPYGAGKQIMITAAIFFAVLLVELVVIKQGANARNVVLVAMVIVATGAILGYGPAKLDQRNRRARRYAVSNRRALEFQDIRSGRLRSIELGANTRVLKLYNEDLESHELPFVNVDESGRAVRSVLFERLHEKQADAILATLRGAGLPLGTVTTGLRVRRRARMRNSQSGRAQP